MKSKLWVTATAVVLAACGGGGDNGSFTVPGASAPAASSEVAKTDSSPLAPGASGPAAGGASTSNPQPSIDAGASGAGSLPIPVGVFRYRALAQSAAVVEQLNEEGQKGWHYDASLPVFIGPVKAALFVSSYRATYSYELGAGVSTESALLEQLDAFGARGFRFTPNIRGAATMFRKDSDRSSSYGYRMRAISGASSLDPAAQSSMPFPGRRTAAQLLAEFNAEGREGYQLGQAFNIASEYGIASSVRLYAKDLQSRATYGYEWLALAETDAAMLEQLNAQGARGFRLKAIQYVYKEGDPMTQEKVSFYEKDETSSTLFSYVAWPAEDDEASLVARADEQGATGFRRLGDLALESAAGNANAKSSTLYMKAVDCGSASCDPSGPFDF